MPQELEDVHDPDELVDVEPDDLDVEDEIDVEETTATTPEIVPSAIEVGMGTLVAASSEDDPVASVVPSAGGPFAALVSDNTIPCGTVVHGVDGRVRR